MKPLLYVVLALTFMILAMPRVAWGGLKDCPNQHITLPVPGTSVYGTLPPPPYPDVPNTRPDPVPAPAPKPGMCGCAGLSSECSPPRYTCVAAATIRVTSCRKDVNYETGEVSNCRDVTKSWETTCGDRESESGKCGNSNQTTEEVNCQMCIIHNSDGSTRKDCQGESRDVPVVGCHPAEKIPGAPGKEIMGGCNDEPDVNGECSGQCTEIKTFYDEKTKKCEPDENYRRDYGCTDLNNPPKPKPVNSPPYTPIYQTQSVR
jgi:hypothetical protein